MSQTLLEMAKDLVMAQIAAHRLSPDEMHTVLQQTYVSRQRHHGKTEGNRAAFETLGESTDVCAGTEESAKGCRTREADGEEESVRRDAHCSSHWEDAVETARALTIGKRSVLSPGAA